MIGVVAHTQLVLFDSFKERGARNALLQLTAEQQRVGVVAASAGAYAYDTRLRNRERD